MKNTRTEQDRLAAVEYGRSLRAARLRLEVSVEQVAAAAGVSKTSVRNWERGDCLPEFLAARRVRAYIRKVGRAAKREAALRLLAAERDGKVAEAVGRAHGRARTEEGMA